MNTHIHTTCTHIHTTCTLFFMLRIWCNVTDTTAITPNGKISNLIFDIFSRDYLACVCLIFHFMLSLFSFPSVWWMCTKYDKVKLEQNEIHISNNNKIQLKPTITMQPQRFVQCDIVFPKIVIFSLNDTFLLEASFSALILFLTGFLNKVFCVFCVFVLTSIVLYSIFFVVELLTARLTVSYRISHQECILRMIFSPPFNVSHHRDEC